MKNHNAVRVLGALPFRQACEVHQKLMSNGEIPKEIRLMVRQAIARNQACAQKRA